MKSSLYKKLELYSREGVASFHMPGHKGRGFDNSPPLAEIAGMDITEIDGFDDLHNPKGIILEVEKKAEELWGSLRCYLSTNGSTGCLLAAVSCACIMGQRQGKNKIAVARNCHKSVYHGVEINNAHPVYIMPRMIEGREMYGSISPESVEELFEREEGVAALVITSPTYEGIVSDIGAISKITKKHGALLIVDEAHGSHLKLMYENEKWSAVDSGADIVVHSLHKTLSALGQSAAVHLPKDSRVCEAEMRRQMGIFTTSSPSYPIMASVDHCLDSLKETHGIFEKLKHDVSAFAERLSGLKHMSIFTGCEGVFGFDRSKIVIFTPKTDYVTARLREMKIECEYSDANHIIAMTGQGTVKQELAELENGLWEIDDSISMSAGEPNGMGTVKTLLTALPKARQIPGCAAKEAFSRIPFKNSLGMVSAAYLWLYPPGIPFVVPGEEISLEALSIMECYGEKIFDSSKGEAFDGTVCIVDDFT